MIAFAEICFVQLQSSPLGFRGKKGLNASVVPFKDLANRQYSRIYHYGNQRSLWIEIYVLLAMPTGYLAV